MLWIRSAWGSRPGTSASMNCARSTPRCAWSSACDEHPARASPDKRRLMHLDAGCDSRPCRAAPGERGWRGEIAARGTPAPIQVGKRWPVERPNSWLNDLGKLRRCTERRRNCVDAHLALAAAVVTARALCRAAWCSTAGLQTTITTHPLTYWREPQGGRRGDVPGCRHLRLLRSTGACPMGQAGAGDGPRTARRVPHTRSVQR